LKPEDAAMVGDSLEDDIEGGPRRRDRRRAFLLDREDRHPEVENRLNGPSLRSPAALGNSAQLSGFH